MPKFGPGTFTVGEAGSLIDASCLVNSLTIEPSKEAGDSTTKLCGTVRPGAITYTYVVSGNVDLDSDDPEGLFALTQLSPGTEVPFQFTPHEGGTSAAGRLILDPLAFGGDEFGADMTSDFEFDTVGAPVYTFPNGAATLGSGPLAKTVPRLVINGRGALPAEVGQASAAAPQPKSTSKKSELVDA